MKKIRQKTCYGTLRSHINVIQIVGFIGVAMFAFALFAGIAQSQLVTRGNPELALVGMLVPLSGCIGAIVFLIADRQAALLLVDIADCQIQMAANKKAAD